MGRRDVTSSSGPNPMAAILRAIQSNRALREELWRDPVASLAPYGIRVPEDVIVLCDGKSIHMRIPLDESDKTG